MTSKRKLYPAEFKAKVAFEALRGELATAQLAVKHNIQNNCCRWRQFTNSENHGKPDLYRRLYNWDIRDYHDTFRSKYARLY